MKIIPTVLASSLAVLALTACGSPEGTDAAPAQTESSPATDTAGDAPPEVATPRPSQPVLLEPARAAELVTVGGKCNIESADGTMFSAEPVAANDKANVAVTGWLAVANPSEPTLRIESADKSQIWEVPLQPSIARDDVTGGGATPGFKASFDATGIQAGRYHLYLVYREASGLMACDNGRQIELR